MTALRCEERCVLIDDEAGEVRAPAVKYASWQPDKRDKSIIDLALAGNKPKVIAAVMGNITADIARAVVKKARAHGYPIPSFRSDPQHGEPSKKSYTYMKPIAAKPQPVRAAVPPNHFELAALKKMLGDDLAEIEGAADAEGKSLAAYVRETMLAEVRKLK